MKYVIFILALVFFNTAIAQDSTEVKVETPKIVSKLQFGKTVQLNDVEIQFIELINDSRCPKGVSCIWAGEVTVLVAIFKKGKKIKTEKITFNELGNTNDIYISKDLSVSAINVSPYPVYREKIPLEDYKIELYVSQQ